MTAHDFHLYAVDSLRAIQAETGIWLDQHFSGYSIAEGFHLDISPAVAAIMRTEMALGRRVGAGTRVRFDLKELDQVHPPLPGENFFVTFLVPGLPGLNEEDLAFALHLTRLPTGSEGSRLLQEHIFKPGTALEAYYSAVIYAITTGGEMRLATTRILFALSPEGSLAAYSLVGLATDEARAARLAPPSEQMMFLLFLTLSSFMLVNQNEASLQVTGDRKATIG